MSNYRAWMDGLTPEQRSEVLRKRRSARRRWKAQNLEKDRTIYTRYVAANWAKVATRNRESQRKTRAERRERLLAGQTCAYCGFSDPRALQIDHTTARKVTGEPPLTLHSAAAAARILSRLLDGTLQILCANCNWSKRHVKNENSPRGPHKSLT